ncbi:hypothetical protein FXW78_25225 [Rhodococcus opacus]|nr:hypothetical protein [Rhodococcus opacus]
MYDLPMTNLPAALVQIDKANTRLGGCLLDGHARSLLLSGFEDPASGTGPPRARYETVSILSPLPDHRCLSVSESIARHPHVSVTPTSDATLPHRLRPRRWRRCGEGAAAVRRSRGCLRAGSGRAGRRW